MLKSKINNHMYSQTDASNVCATDTLKTLINTFLLKWAFCLICFLIFVPYPMIYFKVMSFYLTQLHFLMNHNFYVVFTRNWTLYESLRLIKCKLLLLIILNNKKISQSSQQTRQSLGSLEEINTWKGRGRLSKTPRVWLMF